VNNFAGRFSGLIPHQTSPRDLQRKFRGDSLRDSWDPLSWNFGPKQTNQ